MDEMTSARLPVNIHRFTICFFFCLCRDKHARGGDFAAGAIYLCISCVFVVVGGELTEVVSIQ